MVDGLPKIHKPEPIPMRPIVSSIGSVTYKVAKYQAQILGPLVGKTEHHVHNSKDFVNKITSLTVAEDESVESLDVVGLFTCIPPNDALVVVKSKLEEDDDLSSRTPLSVDQLCDLLSLCLSTTYFSFNSEFYLQLHGCAMGSPVSPIVVNLYMEAFEQRALNEITGIAPRVWLRYVDDVWNLNKVVNHDRFFEKVNQVDDNLKFTREKANANKELPYLDSLSKAEDDGSFSSRVYRKPTHTDQYLQFGSHHPLVHNLGVIRNLNYRADTVITSVEEQRLEKQHVVAALKKCGYPGWAFHKAKKSKEDSLTATRGATAPVGSKQTFVTIPYVATLSDRLKRTFKSFNIQASCKPYNTLRQQLVNVKDKMPREKKSNLVYGYKCPSDQCGKNYVGETKQALKSRLYQHRNPSYGDQFDSAIYTHISESGHKFQNSDVLILDSETRWHERGIKEAIYERIEKPSLTTKLRFKLSHAWDPVLSTIPRRLSATINPENQNQPTGTDNSSHPTGGSGSAHQSAEGL